MNFKLSIGFYLIREVKIVEKLLETNILSFSSL